MIEKMFTVLKKPLLWQRGSEPFWDHEHISKGMLEAHSEMGYDVTGIDYRLFQAIDCVCQKPRYKDQLYLQKLFGA